MPPKLALIHAPDVKQMASALEALRRRVPGLFPDLYAQAFSEPPLTNGNLLTCVVGLKRRTLPPAGTPDISFDVKAVRGTHHHPNILEADRGQIITKRVTLPAAGGIKLVQFEFPMEPDDGDYAYLIYVDAKREVLEVYEGTDIDWSNGNYVIVRGPNW